MSNVFYPIQLTEIPEEDGGGFLAFAPDLSGCMSDGKTPEEALKNCLLAIGEWLDEAAESGREVPEPGAVAKQKRDALKELISVLERQEEAIDKSDKALKQLGLKIDQLKYQFAELINSASSREAVVSYSLPPSGLAIGRSALTGALSHGTRKPAKRRATSQIN
jgi:predicted RNase H-like HicB family nuclease